MPPAASRSSPSADVEGLAKERWVSVEEVAVHVGVRKDSIYRWIERRGFPARKIGKLWKLKLSEVDVWIRAGGSREPADEHRVTESTLPPDVTAPTLQTAPTSFVLIVDDDESFRETLREVVSDQGYGVLCAADGAEALELLRSHGGPQPSVIVLDLQMPNMDGLQFLQAQRRDPGLAPVPVIVVTAERRSDVGGAPVLRKPVDLAKLVHAIASAVGR
jgi:excisionase family DNA binding protein